MLKKSLAALAIAVAVIVASQATPKAPAQTSNAVKIHAGAEVFQKNCMQCHATHEGQYSFGPNLAGEMKAPHPKKSTAEVRTILKAGKNKMPAFGEKLTAPETDNLIAYLKTL